MRSQRAVSLTPFLDNEGFLLDPDTWNDQIAEILATEEVPGGLSQEHWRVIQYLRNYYMDCGSVPPVPMLCRDTGMKFGTVRKLFPSGLTNGACKIAGIPRDAIRPSFLYP
jgi:TusE/DsrC/DsvC family sulfur relay protein